MVAMSGGVDSSVAALLLLQGGHPICGATLRLYSGEETEPCSPRVCCSLENVEDARRVAGQLGFDHFVFNFEQLFEREVIARFIEGYLRGETPNPCIECNRSVKFTPLLARARLLGCEDNAPATMFAASTTALRGGGFCAAQPT